MKSFRQYITEVERYDYTPPDPDFVGNELFNWTIGGLSRWANFLGDGPPIPNDVFDRYPWKDSTGTWKKPPPGWRVIDQNSPINDRNNWEYIPRPWIRGPDENGRWIWIPAGGGKWVYTTSPPETDPPGSNPVPTDGEVQTPAGNQEKPWSPITPVQNNQSDNVNESWWRFVPGLIPWIPDLFDPPGTNTIPDPLYLPPLQNTPYFSPTLVPSPTYPGYYERPIIDPQDPSQVPIRYTPPIFSPTSPTQYPPMGEQEKWDTVFPNSTAPG